jgi:Ca2+-dependent lipid-binding protein
MATEERKLNRNCKLKVTVESATFLKDADTWGKQDPFVMIECADYRYKTKVIEEGGKNCTWNEEFTMREVMNEID